MKKPVPKFEETYDYYKTLLIHFYFFLRLPAAWFLSRRLKFASVGLRPCLICVTVPAGAPFPGWKERSDFPNWKGRPTATCWRSPEYCLSRPDVCPAIATEFGHDTDGVSFGCPLHWGQDKAIEPGFFLNPSNSRGLKSGRSFHLIKPPGILTTKCPGSNRQWTRINTNLSIILYLDLVSFIGVYSCWLAVSPLEPFARCLVTPYE